MLRGRKSWIPRRTALATLLIAATFAPVCDHRAEAGSERRALVPGSWEAEEALLFDPSGLPVRRKIISKKPLPAGEGGP